MCLARPGARRTEAGSLSVSSRAGGWSRPSTFLVGDHPGVQCMPRTEADRLAAMQEAYLDDASVLRLDRTLGRGGESGIGVSLTVERRDAHVAAVFDLLSQERRGGAEPAAAIVCTPGLRVDGYPDGRVVAVDLERGVTRIYGTDFPGEAKRAGLRLWAKRTWQSGGLPLHAAVKAGSGAPGARPVITIAGRPGAGKTSIAFAESAITAPCQEDRVAWMPDGTLVPAESAFFAPASSEGGGLRPLVERALADPRSLLLNVGPRAGAAGEFAPVGRVIFEPAAVGAPVLAAGERPSALVLLVRNQNVLPALARLDSRVAAAIFTASQVQQRAASTAGGMRETLGASPLFPVAAAQEGARLRDLLDRHAVPVYMLNTWRVGGPAGVLSSRKVEPRVSAALVDAIATQALQFGDRDDLGLLLADPLPGIGRDLLDPRALYARAGRLDEHRLHVARLRRLWAAASRALDVSPAPASVPA